MSITCNFFSSINIWFPSYPNSYCWSPSNWEMSSIIKEERRAASPFLHLLPISFKKTNKQQHSSVRQLNKHTMNIISLWPECLLKSEWEGFSSVCSWQKLDENTFNKMIPWYSSTSYIKCKGELPFSVYISGIATGTYAVIGAFYLR